MQSDDLYDPSYTDMLRVVFASEFKRGRLEDLVALISGRNFETEQFEESIVENSFERLGNGISRYINESYFKSFMMILHSAGFVDSSMIGSQNALNFAYALYLTLKAQGVQGGSIQQLVRLLVRHVSSNRPLFCIAGISNRPGYPANNFPRFRNVCEYYYGGDFFRCLLGCHTSATIEWLFDHQPRFPRLPGSTSQIGRWWFSLSGNLRQEPY